MVLPVCAGQGSLVPARNPAFSVRLLQLFQALWCATAQQVGFHKAHPRGSWSRELDCGFGCGHGWPEKCQEPVGGGFPNFHLSHGAAARERLHAGVRWVGLEHPVIHIHSRGSPGTAQRGPPGCSNPAHSLQANYPTHQLEASSAVFLPVAARALSLGMWVEAG